MKKVVVLVMLSLFSLSTSFASGNPELFKEIKRKISFDFNQVEMTDVSENSVTVNFRIVNDKIKILEINGSNRSLKKALIKELYEMNIDANHSEDKTYLYKFTFETA